MKLIKVGRLSNFSYYCFGMGLLMFLFAK